MNIEKILEPFTQTINSLIKVLNESDLPASAKMGALLEVLRISHATFRGKDINAKDFHCMISTYLVDNFPSNLNREKSCTNSTETIQ